MIRDFKLDRSQCCISRALEPLRPDLVLGITKFSLENPLLASTLTIPYHLKGEECLHKLVCLTINAALLLHHHYPLWKT